MRYRIDVVTKSRRVDGHFVYHISFWIKHNGFLTSLFLHIPCGKLILPESIPENVITLCKHCGQPLDDASLSPYIAYKDTTDVVAAKLARIVEGLIRTGNEVELHMYRTSYSPAQFEGLTKFEYSRAIHNRLHREEESGLYTWERLQKDMETRDLTSLMKMFLA